MLPACELAPTGAETAPLRPPLRVGAAGRRVRRLRHLHYGAPAATLRGGKCGGWLAALARPLAPLANLPLAPLRSPTPRSIRSPPPRSPRSPCPQLAALAPPAARLPRHPPTCRVCCGSRVRRRAPAPCAYAPPLRRPASPRRYCYRRVLCPSLVSVHPTGHKDPAYLTSAPERQLSQKPVVARPNRGLRWSV